jgi:hypothetical protein
MFMNAVEEESRRIKKLTECKQTFTLRDSQQTHQVMCPVAVGHRLRDQLAVARFGC